MCVLWMSLTLGNKHQTNPDTFQIDEADSMRASLLFFFFLFVLLHFVAANFSRRSLSEYQFREDGYNRTKQITKLNEYTSTATASAYSQVDRFAFSMFQCHRIRWNY